MASTEKLIRITIMLNDKMSSELNKSANALKDMGKNLTDIGQKMTVGLTMPIVAGGIAMMKTFADFDSVIAELGARTGSTAEEMKKMSDFALQMGRDTAFSATEAAQALLELTSSGSSAAEAMEMLPQVLNLAAAGALELGQAADAVTDIMAQFNVGLADTQTVVDILTQAAGASSATVEDLIAGFANAGPVLHQFGLSVENSAAAMAVLAENGIKGAEAGTQLKSMMLNMSRDTNTVTAAWKELGVSMFDSQGNMRGIDAIFKDINAAMEGMSTEEQIRLSQDLAGSYGIVGFNALRASNGISDMEAAMLNAAGAESVAEARMNTLAGKFDQFMGSLETLGIVMGGLAEGPMVWLLESATNVINAFSEWAQINPAMAQTLMVVLAIVAAIGPLLMIIGQIAGGISAIAALGPMLAGITAAIPGVIAGFTALLAPFAPLIAALGLLYLAYQTNFLGIRSVIDSTMSFVGNALAKAGQTLQQLGVIIQKAWEQMNQQATGTLGQLGTILSTAWGNMLNQAGTAFGQLLSIAGLMTAKLFQVFTGMGNDVMKGLIIGILSRINEFIAAVREMAEGAAQAVRNALGIASPSKVMMKMGEQTVQGFQKGIESMGGIGVNVNGRSVTGSAPSLAMAGASSGGNGGGTVFNIYTAQGTTDQQALEIAHKVDKILGRKAKRYGGKK